MTANKIRVGIGQMACAVANVPHNLDQVADLAARARQEGVEVLVCPELALTGYQVGRRFSEVALRRDSPEIDRLRELSDGLVLVVGFIEETPHARFFNSALCLHDRHILHVHRKVYPPTYGIFDERRYYGAGRDVAAFDTPVGRMAMLICGDCWHLSLPYLAAHDGADLLLVLAASAEEGLSPTISSRHAWERLNQTYALTLSCFVVFSNRAGTEDGLHFWGGSHLVGPDGQMIAQGAIGEPDFVVGDLDLELVRRQRILLPFRRDDNLDLTLRVGQRILDKNHHP